MYKSLPPSVKSSITKSISKVFEKYMTQIEWQEEKYQLVDFLAAWKAYIENEAKWYKQVPEETKLAPAFHESIAERINQTIERIVNEPPSEEQVARIEAKQELLHTSYDYACRAEADFIEEKLVKKSLD
ncbi:hypothetical protein ACQKDD_10005 [Planococcus kocurii]|uniref:Group-specific protein n=1 Tax=Planococcus faecalis TaxID=1598147 RepID=A0ABN4XSL5_9BACL|nr:MULTISPECIES: hypothetical protein [Planococcus]AQU80289.1 hypothetical protein AJGP001_13845 [Planococcus faecalis]KAA0958815.1 hypothetical protein FQ085_03605 [Planococcus sp. ANT_H30]OHX55086.1 hypothetical protein BB777_05040 [Planococcus faecalis]